MSRRKFKVAHYPEPGQKDAAFRGGVDAHNASLDYLASSLSYLMGSTVVNKTGIQGRFRYRLKWNPEADRLDSRSGDDRWISVLTALQEQLGLKLESRKGDVEFLVIDGVDRPSEN